MPWLFKTEPSAYSFARLEADGRTVWDGVKNALALRHLAAVATGDEVLVYHTGDEKAAVGIARVARGAYPDPKQKDAKLIVFGGIPFNLCLGISSADVGDNALADLRYRTGRHTAPVFAGDTVFAKTEIREVRDMPGRPDLGVLDTILRGHKFVRKGDVADKVDIFYLERELVLKRRSHYT